MKWDMNLANSFLFFSCFKTYSLSKVPCSPYRWPVCIHHLQRHVHPVLLSAAHLATLRCVFAGIVREGSQNQFHYRMVVRQGPSQSQVLCVCLLPTFT